MTHDLPWGLVVAGLAVVALVALVGWEVGRRIAARRRITRWLRERRDG